MLPNYKEIIELIKKGSTIEAQEKIMELREGAIELQEQNIQLRERIRELEGQVKAVSDWEEQKNRYALVSPWNGPAQAYALKESHSQGERPHLLCTNCFHNSKRVLLNPSKSKDGFIALICPTCKASLDTGYRGIGEPMYAESYLERRS